MKFHRYASLIGSAIFTAAAVALALVGDLAYAAPCAVGSLVCLSSVPQFASGDSLPLGFRLRGQAGAVSLFAPPNWTDVQKYQVNVASSQECIYQPLYDTLIYPAAGTNNLQFFAQQQGQGGKTLAQTNMQQGGSLPTPKYFLITDIQIGFYPGILPQVNAVLDTATSLNFVNDVWKPLQAGAGYLILTVGSKQYLQDAPLCKFPPDHGFTGTVALTNGVNAAVANTAADAIQYFRPAGDIYRIVPILLIPNQNFDVTLYWPSLVTLPSGQPANIEVTLGGFQYRLSQ